MPLSAQIDALAVRIASEFKKIRNEFTDRVNVKAFGAVGNWNTATGTGTDDTLALQSAADVAHDRGLPLYLPPGTYYGTIVMVNKSLRIHPASVGRIAHPKALNAIWIQHIVNTGFGIIDTQYKWITNNDNENPAQLWAQLTTTEVRMLENQPNQGDMFLINSADAYEGDYLGQKPKNVYQQEWVKVFGIGIDINTTNSNLLPQGAFVTGETSKATAWIGSIATPVGDTQRMLVLNKVRPGVVGGVSKYFAAGENLLINGVVVGSITTRAPYIIVQDMLETYTTTPKLVRPQTGLPVDLSYIKIVASDDTDEFLAGDGANRKAAIQLETVVGFRAHRAHIESTWKSGIELRGCVNFEITDLRIDKMPGYAEDGEAGWGYGVSCYGSTEHGTVHFAFAQNGRHGFTTNVRPTTGPPGTPDYIATQGVAKYITVSGNFHNFTDAALDTHGGSYFIDFVNFRITNSGGHNRTQARVAGIQNRSFGGTVKNGHIENVVDGIRDVSNVWPAPMETVTTYENITMSGIRRFGFNCLSGTKGSELKGTTKVVIKDVNISFYKDKAGRPVNPNPQYGIRADVGRFELINFNTYGFRTGAGLFGKPYDDLVPANNATLDELIIRGGYTDHSGQPTGTETFNSQSNIPIPILMIEGHKVRGGVLSNGNSIIRSRGNAQIIYTEGCTFFSTFTTSTLPFFNNTGTSIEIRGLKETGAILKAQLSNYTATIANAASTTQLIPVTGAVVGDYVFPPVFTVPLANGVLASATVSATDTVKMVLYNASGASVTLASGSVRIMVQKA